LGPSYFFIPSSAFDAPIIMMKGKTGWNSIYYQNWWKN
jgi:hypothetical protein